MINSLGHLRLVGRRTVVGRGRRRIGLLVLLALPVLLSTLAAGVFASAAASAEQRATEVMGSADGYVNSPDAAASDRLRAELEHSAPGLTVLPIDGSVQFPVWSGNRTVDVRYQDTDWSSPLVRGKYRVLEGRFPAELGEIAVSGALADELKLGIGDTLPYRWKRDAPAKIVGLVESPLGHANRDYLAAPGQLRAWPRTGSDTTNVMPPDYGLLLDGSDRQLAAAQTVVAERQLLLEARAQVADARTLVEREPALLLAPGIVVLGVVAAGAFSLRMRRTRAEFAILAALGFSDRALRMAAVFGALSASLIAVPVGWCVGSVLVLVGRPVLPSLTGRDISPYDPLLVEGATTVLLSIAVAAATAVLTTRYPAGLPARVRARATPRENARRSVIAPLLCGLAAVAFATARMLSAEESAAICAVAGIALLSAAALTRVGDVLRFLARVTDRSFSARIALRAFARDPRRPVSAIVIGSVALAVTVGVLGTLSSVAAQERATYVGSRHLGQVEALLYSGTRPQVAQRAMAGVFPEGTPIVRGTTLVGKEQLAAATTPALTPGWTIAEQAGGHDGRVQPIEIVDSADKFHSLTGRSWSPREQSALKDGHVLVLAPAFADGDRVTLSVPSGGEKPDKRRTVEGAVPSDPVDATTLTRASAYVTTATARSWGAVTMDYSIIASPEDPSPAADLEKRLSEALEPVDIVMSDVRIETGPTSPPAVLWYVLLGLALAAVVTTLGIVVTSSATELRPDLVRLHRIGIAPRTIRRVIVWQSSAIAALAAVLGLVAGWGLTAARIWPHDAPVVMNWEALGALTVLTILLGWLYGMLAAPRRISNTLHRTEA
jgi:hypothetical protein